MAHDIVSRPQGHAGTSRDFRPNGSPKEQESRRRRILAGLRQAARSAARAATRFEKLAQEIEEAPMTTRSAQRALDAILHATNSDTRGAFGQIQGAALDANRHARWLLPDALTSREKIIWEPPVRDQGANGRSILAQPDPKPFIAAGAQDAVAEARTSVLEAELASIDWRSEPATAREAALRATILERVEAAARTYYWPQVRYQEIGVGLTSFSGASAAEGFAADVRQSWQRAHAINQGFWSQYRSDERRKKLRAIAEQSLATERALPPIDLPGPPGVT